MRLSTIMLAALAVMTAGVANAELVYGVTQQNRLVSFNSNAPGSILTGISIQGLQVNEDILGMDIRPATGQLYAIGSSNRLYTINALTGQATQVGGVFANPLNGSSFGFDFNPTIDRIRVVSNANNNYVLNPDTGAQTIATPLFYQAGDPNFGADPNVVHSAYTNAFPGATTSQLYGLDTGLDILVTQANSAGTLGTVGPVGADLTELGGFDISGASGTAYAIVRDNAQIRSMLWTINLQTGAGSFVGQIGGGEIITAMTVVPAPSSALALAAAGLIAARRRRA
ncbi:MAG TPA: DUF4394 domain-containing protein [Phycisphaerales bacterium]|nr:DUF4394 domain-containing protein [Phycisphaerales bacterium]